MEFTVLTEKEFDTYALKDPCSNFHQTVKWGLLKKKNGWMPHFLGVKNGKNILCAALILEKKVLKKYSIFYSPRGYLIDFSNYKLLKHFTTEIKKFAKNKKGIFIKIDPYLVYKERDINGQVIPDGIDNTESVNNLRSLGYKHTGFNLKHENMQPRWAFAIDLRNKSADDVLNNMESKTRQLIRKNIRNNIEIREIELEELNIFKSIMNHTSERRNFIDRPFEYYKNMLEILGDNAKIYIAELNVDDLVNNINKQIQENKKIITTKQEELNSNSKKINIEKTKRKVVEITEENKRLEEKAISYQKIIDEDGKRIILGGIIYMTYNKEILSLFGGSYDKYMDFLSFYTIHWEMIKYAIENGYEKYNFYGISGDFEDKNDELYGLYDFKRGFGGKVEEYIGEFDLVISKPLYWIYKYGYSLYKKLRK